MENILQRNKENLRTDSQGVHFYLEYLEAQILKTKNFLMYQGGSKGNIGKKWVNTQRPKMVSHNLKVL